MEVHIDHKGALSLELSYLLGYMIIIDIFIVLKCDSLVLAMCLEYPNAYLCFPLDLNIMTEPFS